MIRHKTLIMSGHALYMSGCHDVELNLQFILKVVLLNIWFLSCTIFEELHRSPESHLVPSIAIGVLIHNVLGVCQEVVRLK